MKLTKIHKDDRGSIYSIEDDNLGHPEVTIFFTKKNKARGGCIHKKSDEYTCIISGMVEYQIGDKKILLGLGCSTVIPSNTPHYFKSLTDSVVLEWGAKISEKKQKHKKFREIVDRINAC